MSLGVDKNGGLKLYKYKGEVRLLSSVGSVNMRFASRPNIRHFPRVNLRQNMTERGWEGEVLSNRLGNEGEKLGNLQVSCTGTGGRGFVSNFRAVADNC